MKIKLTKLEELPDARHPYNISVGYEKELNVSELDKPTVGERFPSNTWWSTSVVQEVIDEHTFRTYNSIYKWEVVEDEL